ncbi:M24 family metallopeptidase [Sinorhizobium medicae]|uniref:M24 family metallopeptidase n=1 Tax=Sinorhizobium medicae TaxID=110321 RepID=UPI00396A524A
MRKASAIADATFRDLSANICPGMTERDLVRMTVESYVRHGGDATYAGTMVIRREDELDILHGHLNDGVIEAGDVLHVGGHSPLSGLRRSINASDGTR